MAHDRIRDSLARIELFRDLTPEELAHVAARVVVADVARGDLIFEEHSPRKNLHVIEKGEVELFKKLPMGGERRLAFFGARDFLGEGSLMDDYPHSASARALLDCRILKISRDAFAELVRDEPAIATKILSRTARVISRRMRHASARFADAGAQYISGRTRSEHDLLGDREVPHEYYYGIQTLRALENFNISGIALEHYPV